MCGECGGVCVCVCVQIRKIFFAYFTVVSIYTDKKLAMKKWRTRKTSHTYLQCCVCECFCLFVCLFFLSRKAGDYDLQRCVLYHRVNMVT